jgi:hypothetical protein
MRLAIVNISVGQSRAECYFGAEGFGMMYYDYNKRSYLLPPGCKDLIDLLKLEQQKKRPLGKLPMSESGDMFMAGIEEVFGPWKLKNKKTKEPAIALPGIPSMREVAIPDEILVLELAKIAGQKPFRIIADLMEIGIFANVKQNVGFDAASRVLKKYGITAKKTE